MKQAETSAGWVVEKLQEDAILGREDGTDGMAPVVNPGHVDKVGQEIPQFKI